MPDGNTIQEIAPAPQRRFEGLRKFASRITKRSTPQPPVFPQEPLPKTQADEEKIADVRDEISHMVEMQPDTSTLEEVAQPDASIVYEKPDTGKIFDTSEIFGQHAAESAPENASEEEIVDSLKPKIEEDNAGFHRTIYHREGVTFAFRGREELPLYPTAERSATRLLGDKPLHVSEEVYLEYKADINTTELAEGKPSHLIATKTPLGVVELAIALGGENAKLAELQDSLRRREFTPETLALMDALIAANYIDESERSFLGKTNPHAEATVVLALLGEPDAQELVAKKLTVLKELDREHSLEGEDQMRESEPLDPHDLVCVHATRYRPTQDGEGNFIVPTTFDATGGKMLRNSIHTALNHKVENTFFGGEWNGTDYVIVSPFEKMDAVNGSPTVLNTVDTWWLRNPGEPLVFPDATIVEAGGSNVGGLVETAEDGVTLRFKSEGYDMEDLKTLVGEVKSKGDYRYGLFAKDINSTLGGVFDSTLAKDYIRDAWRFDSEKYQFVAREKVEEFLYGNPPEYSNEGKLLESVLEAGNENRGLEEVLVGIVNNSNIPQGLKEGVDREAAVKAVAHEAASMMVRYFIRPEINRLAVEQAIKQKGFTPQPGGDWAWGDSWDVTARTQALAQKLGVISGAHSATVESDLTSVFSETTQAAGVDDRGQETFQWQKYDPGRYDALIPEIDQKSRRVLYASGVLVARN